MKISPSAVAFFALPASVSGSALESTGNRKLQNVWAIALDKGTDGSSVSADFTAAAGVNGVVTNSWTFEGPNLSLENETTNQSYTFQTILKAGLCSGAGTSTSVDSTMLSGGPIVPTSGALGVGVSVSGGVPGTCSQVVSGNGGSKSKTCIYEFDKTYMGFVGYTADDATQRLCEIAQLQWNGMVIAEKYVNIQVTFDLVAGFDVLPISMTAATIESSTENTSLAGYITAATCTTSTSLSPNEELCVKISSSSPDVLIESIDAMTMNGPKVNGAGGTLAVIKDSSIEYAAITNIGGTYPAQEIEVKTMVPTNLFDFEADASSAKLDITGSVTVKFAGARRLISLDRLLQANEAESAEFSLNVNLAPGPDAALEDGDAAMMNSAKATAGKAFATLGMVFASAFALW